MIVDADQLEQLDEGLKTMDTVPPAARGDTGQNGPAAVGGAEAGELPRPSQARQHHDPAKGGNPRPQTYSAPGERSDSCGVDRIVDFKDTGQPRELHHLPYGRAESGKPQAAGDPLSAGVATNQGPDPGTVNRRHTTEVDHQVPVTAPKQLLKMALERFGRTAADQRLLRRQNEPAADAFLLAWHKDKVWFEGSRTAQVSTEYTPEPRVGPAVSRGLRRVPLRDTRRDRRLRRYVI